MWFLRVTSVWVADGLADSQGEQTLITGIG